MQRHIQGAHTGHIRDYRATDATTVATTGTSAATSGAPPSHVSGTYNACIEHTQASPKPFVCPVIRCRAGNQPSFKPRSDAPRPHAPKPGA
jgi:hypothetical protein